MNERKTVQTSKFLSLILRHDPGMIGLTLDPAGWADVGELLARLNAEGNSITLEQLNHVVSTNSKKRFEFSADGLRIRASQGHSIEVDLQYVPSQPPPVLYHGTATRFLGAIRVEGLRKMQRHHVHLSAETAMTLQVGARHGKPALLTIDAAAMAVQGHEFFHSTNSVWLVEHVPPAFITFPQA